jgi:hypothetical protein
VERILQRIGRPRRAFIVLTAEELMRVRLLLILTLLTPIAAHAQDFGVMESAETINRGNFKLRVNPLLFFGKHGGDSDGAVAALVGYGFTPRFDLEGGVALGDDLTIFGATAEFNVARDRPFNFSIIPGLHFRRGDRTLESTGFDLIFLGSVHPTSRLDVYGALDFAFESVTDDRVGNADYKTIHLVPGLEYKLQENVDVLAEFGIGLNDPARHYVTGGLAFYFR